MLFIAYCLTNISHFINILLFIMYIGDYSLEISPVALEDDAVFQCQVGALDGAHGIRSRSASFTVQVPPEAPVIIVTHAHSHAQVYQSSNENAGGAEMLVSAGSSLSSGSFASSSSSSSTSTSTMNDNHLKTNAGMTIELTCEAHGGRPPAEVSISKTYIAHN